MASDNEKSLSNYNTDGSLKNNKKKSNSGFTGKYKIINKT